MMPRCLRLDRGGVIAGRAAHSAALHGRLNIRVKNIFEHNAQTLRELKEAIDTSVVDRDLNEEHHQKWALACERFHSSFDGLAFPGGLAKELDLLRAGDEQAIEMAVRFLEADPFFFRSGYIKAELLRAMRRVQLSDNQKERLRSVIVERIRSGGRREFREYCRLARSLVNSEFRQMVKKEMASTDHSVSRRARWIEQALES